MRPPKQLIAVLGLFFTLCMLTACARAPGQPTAVPSPIAVEMTSTPTAVPSPTAEEMTSAPEKVLPLDVPIGFESLLGLSATVMLPPQFPLGEGLPALQPFILNAENGNIDVSLDYGPDCKGAGACHYGSLSVKKVASEQPESTLNFVFDAGRAQSVTLAKNITGYYLEGLCGASCDDSKVF
jgi:hypothetical protein